MLRKANTSTIGLCLRNDIQGFSIQQNPNNDLETITRIYPKNIDNKENSFCYIYRVGSITSKRIRY